MTKRATVLYKEDVYELQCCQREIKNLSPFLSHLINDLSAVLWGEEIMKAKGNVFKGLTSVFSIQVETYFILEDFHKRKLLPSPWLLIVLPESTTYVKSLP